MQTDRLRDSQRAARASRSAAAAELEQIAAAAEREQRSTLTAEETRRFETLRGEIERLDADLDSFAVELVEALSREQRAARAAGVPTSCGGGRDLSHLGETERSAIARVESSRMLPDAGKERLVSLIERGDDRKERGALATWAYTLSDPAYSRAFSKWLADPDRGHLSFSAEEIESWNAAREVQRALVVGTNAQGGFLVPTHLDPSIILTNSGSLSPMRRISRTETLALGGANVWNGITSAGVDASWDAETAVVSDDSPTVGSASVPLHMGRAWIEASFELIEDSDIASQVAALFADAKDRLEASAFATGSGSGQPTGIWTALDANTNVELQSTTAATIGLVDLQTVYRTLPARYRGRSTWVMNPLYQTAIQQLGTAVSASFTVTATDQPERLLTKPLETDDAAPSTQTTTVRDNEVILGDFSNYVIVDKVAAQLEFVPHTFDPSTGRPNGRRGWLLHWRSGGASVNDSAFRLLQDRTSA